MDILSLQFAGSAGVSPAGCRQRLHYRPNEQQTPLFYVIYAAFVFLGRRDAGAPGKPEIKIIHCHNLDSENYARLGAPPAFPACHAGRINKLDVLPAVDFDYFARDVP
jgi:hypothetical protein